MRDGKLPLMIACAVFAALWISQIIKNRDVADELDRVKGSCERLQTQYLSLEKICTSAGAEEPANPTLPEEKSAPTDKPEAKVE